MEEKQRIAKAIFATIGLITILYFFSLAIFGNRTGPKGEPDYNVTSQPSEAMIISTAMEDLKGRLKDPSSAEFSEMKVSRRNGATVVCGYVNAKNSFGGMTGRERFVVSGLAATMESDVEAGGFQPVWDAFC